MDVEEPHITNWADREPDVFIARRGTDGGRPAGDRRQGERRQGERRHGERRVSGTQDSGPATEATELPDLRASAGSDAGGR